MDLIYRFGMAVGLVFGMFSDFLDNLFIGIQDGYTLEISTGEGDLPEDMDEDIQ